ncbi:MAG: type II secretion system F family protein [Xanthobacteraceae bacterium]|nr:type II secretion system F family protein [Xanthobacteraceae bacterium]PWB59224.1 MAG: type II secretion protein F [Bradyrhizobiaceae bacterium]
MDALLDQVLPLFGGDATLALSLFVFLSATLLAFGAMAAMQVRLSVRRRAAELAVEGGAPSAEDPRSLRYASRQATQRLIDYTSKHFSTVDAGEMKELRRRLIQAGFLDPRAPVLFFLARALLAVVLAGAGFVTTPLVLAPDSALYWPAIWFQGLVGYFAPNIVVNRRIKARQLEHQQGFPDFMDLLVVCADAGLSMEAALDRVGRELSDSYPSLSSNIHMAMLEIRAGRTMSDALEHFGDRLGLEEARSFATLLQQSEKLGSSLTDALRVYSEDMRHKRLSRAEEKAYSLPAKLSVPLIICVFPVVIIVILLPVYVRLKMGAW